jgi:hypothetical protein
VPSHATGPFTAGVRIFVFLVRHWMVSHAIVADPRRWADCDVAHVRQWPGGSEPSEEESQKQ